MYNQIEADKKERRKIIAVATIAVAVILALIVAIVVVATKKTARNTAGAAFDEVQGKFQILPGGGGLVLHPDPVWVDAHGGQLIVHTFRFRHGLVAAPAAGYDGDGIGIGV